MQMTEMHIREGMNESKARRKCNNNNNNNSNNKQRHKRKQERQRKRNQLRIIGASTSAQHTPRKQPPTPNYVTVAPPCLLITIQPPGVALLQKEELVVNSRVTESGTATADSLMRYACRVVPPPTLHELKVNSSEFVLMDGVTTQVAAERRDTVSIWPSCPSPIAVTRQAAPPVLPTALMYR